MFEANDIVNEALHYSECYGRTMVIARSDDGGVHAVEAHDYMTLSEFDCRVAVWIEYLGDDGWRLTTFRDGKAETNYVSYQQANRIA